MTVPRASTRGTAEKERGLDLTDSIESTDLPRRAPRATDRSALRLELDAHSVPMKDLTVLAPQNDPYRVDTPAGHRDGEWLAMQIERLDLAGRTVHLRGLHYACLGQNRPDGTRYINDEKCWKWISGSAAKAARWLGYVGWDQVVDQRNAEPTIVIHRDPQPRPAVSLGATIEIPDADELQPRVVAKDFTSVQPYKLVMFGEKSSLSQVLSPIAKQYRCDLYLPSGEISDTLMHTMARVGAEDGRRMVVFCFSDSDPGGWQMPISIARKLQAFRSTLYPDLDFEVRRVALTPDQVQAYGLPSEPLKDTEKRATKWREATGVDQTEIDAMVGQLPDELRRLARQSLEQFYDRSLDVRVRQARQAWLAEAQTRLEASIGAEQLERYRAEAAAKLAEMSDLIDQLDQAMQVDIDFGDLPPMDVPQAHIPPRPDADPLVDSDWSFPEQCARLKQAKDYLSGEADA